MDLNFEARRLLRQQLDLAAADYARLAEGLALKGVRMTPKALSNKINRGTFSFSFFIQCLLALGVETPTLNLTHLTRHVPLPGESPER